MLPFSSRALKYCSLALLAAATTSVAFHEALADALTTFTLTSSNSSVQYWSLGNSNIDSTVMTNPASNLTAGSNYTYNYISQSFTPSVSGTYTFGQSSASTDTVMLLYVTSFNKTTPGTNAVVGNDDGGLSGRPAGVTLGTCGDPDGGYCPQISSSLTANTTYYIVISTFSPGTTITLPSAFYVYGAAEVTVEGVYVPTGHFAPIVVNTGAASAAAAMDNLLGTATGTLSTVLTGISTMTSESQQRAAIQSTTVSFPQVPSTAAIQGVRTSFNDVTRWMGMGMSMGAAGLNGASIAPIRSSFSDGGTSQLGQNFQQLAMSESAINAGRPIWSNGEGANFFMNVAYVGGGSNATPNNAGSSYNGIAGTMGASFDLDENFTVGSAFGLNRTYTDIDGSRGDATSGSYNLIGFSHFKTGEGFYADAIANIGKLDYNYTRKITGGATTINAYGDTSGWMAGGSLGGGYDFDFGDAESDGVLSSLVGGPIMQVQYQHSHLGKYSEKDAGTAGLNIGAQNSDSLTARFGGRAIAKTDTAYGTFVPSLTLAYEREFMNNSSAVQSAYQGGGAYPFVTPVDSGARDFAIVGVGLAKDFTNGVTTGVTYEGRLNPAETQHTLALRLNVDF